jgi:teichuronic acid biosynthesis glycosyltransferase TuaC
VTERDHDRRPAPEMAAGKPPRRLRVLVFTMVFPNPGQPLHGTFVLERVRHLAALADIRVVVPVPWHHMLRRQAQPPEAAPILSVRHPRFWYPPKVLPAFRGFFLFLSTVREIGRLRETFDFDLIDAHFAYPDGFAAILLGRWFRRPTCITLRGTIVQWSRRPLGRWLCDWAIRRAQRVIAVAQNLADRARQGGVAEHRIATIANGVDSERFRLIDRAAARRCLGLPEDGRLIVSVGHLSPRKGFHRVIRSLPQLVETCPDARLAIVGGRGAEQDNSAELHALVRDLCLADRVLFAGAQAPDDVALWLGAADAFVLASDFEGCPNVILEAMACGRPVVATKVGDVERMVPAFAGILLDDPEDGAALAESMVAALTRDWDTRRIRDHVATQSWDDVARRVAAQWLLAVETFRAAKADGSGSTADLVTAVVRNPEA